MLAGILVPFSPVGRAQEMAAGCGKSQASNRETVAVSLPQQRLCLACHGQGYVPIPDVGIYFRLGGRGSWPLGEAEAERSEKEHIATSRGAPDGWMASWPCRTRTPDQLLRSLVELQS